MVEPNNIASSMVRDSIDFGGDIDALVESVRFRLICERGKQNLGEGHNSVGDLIPGYCALAGLSDVKVYQSDKASPLIPPYATKGEQVLLAQYQTWEENQKAAFNKKELLKYHRAGGGSDEAFERQWLQHQTTALAFKNGITAHALHSAGGVITYLTSGRKKKNAGGG